MVGVVVKPKTAVSLANQHLFLAHSAVRELFFRLSAPDRGSAREGPDADLGGETGPRTTALRVAVLAAAAAVVVVVVVVVVAWWWWLW